MNFENTILHNFMIIGIKPSTLWSMFNAILGSLLINKLTNHQPEILYSYPMKNELYKVLLKVIFHGYIRLCSLKNFKFTRSNQVNLA